MSCPYFWPVERRAGCGPRDTMMPLGGVWMGQCCALPGEPWTPDEVRLRKLCNLGYARGVCERFPADGSADAVRFTIVADDGITVRLYHVVERDHHPLAHGAMEFGLKQFSRPEQDRPGGLSYEERQARAYVESYLALK